MSFPIVPLARIEREAKDAAERGLTLADACPYPFAGPAGTEFRRVFLDHVDALMALDILPEPQP